jgi:bifunctional oligoribonuclease and PAP phosphatase NrnA
MDETSARMEDQNNLVNIGRDIEGVEISVLFKEAGPRETKVSMRTNGGFDAAAFLRQFGGGGHAGAAGLTLEQPLDEVQDLIVAQLTGALGGEEA